MAALSCAFHMLGVIFTPVGWRAAADEIQCCLEDAEAAALAFDGAAGDAVPQAAAALKIDPSRLIVAADGKGEGKRFESLRDAAPVAGPSAPNEFSTCLILYPSGPTGRTKGVPRTHRAALRASISHIAQNQYRQGDSCLGVMPLFHTMGIRILLGAGLLNGRLVFVPNYPTQQ